MTRVVAILAVLCCSSYAVADTLFLGHLTGDQNVPPVNTPATGTGVITLHQGAAPLVTTILSGFNLTSQIFASHIHIGAVGVNGLVEFGLAGADFANPVIGVWDDRPRLSPPRVSRDIPALLDGRLYYVIHTDAHGGGELRGQIYALDGYEVDETAQIFIAALAPDVSDGPYGAGAMLVVILNSDQTEALLLLSAPGIDGEIVASDIFDGCQVAFPLLGPGEYQDPVIKTWSDGLDAFISDLQNGLLSVTIQAVGGAVSQASGPLYPIDSYPIIHP
jgi:hypothetical protein